ncbi:hypothetical protein ABZ639_14435 [Saccharomonospora sp. NPDC006951]
MAQFGRRGGAVADFPITGTLAVRDITELNRRPVTCGSNVTARWPPRRDPP